MPFSDGYIKMCKAAYEIQELKLLNQRETNKWYKFDNGDFYEQNGIVHKNDTEWIFTIDASRPYFINVRYWIPEFQQLLKIYQENHDIPHESWALLWLANWLEDKVKEDHSFCVIKYETVCEVAILWVMEECYGKKWDGEKFK